MGSDSIILESPAVPPTLDHLDRVSSHLPSCRQRVYALSDLEVLNLLETPAWVFDVREKCMLWANDEGVSLWGANSLKELVARDFASDMSKATERVMLDQLQRFHRGGSDRLTWTFHPNSGKDGPKTCELILSGIYIHKERKRRDREVQNEQQLHETDKEPYFASLVVVNKIIAQRTTIEQTDEEKTALRQTEMLKHFPIIARQFSMEGQLMDQNPEALAVFGSPSDASASEMSMSGLSGCATAKRKDSHDKSKIKKVVNHFLAQFVDLDEGRQVWEELKEGNECRSETLQYTPNGQSWFSIDVRQFRDPITSEKTILYSARDISKLMKYAQDQAEQQNIARTEFFAVMAHEIRTPLHQVLGSIELLERSNGPRYPLSEEQQDCLQILRTSSTAMMAVINDSLDFSKLEAGKLVLEDVQFKIRGVIDGCVAAVQPQAEKYDLRIRTSIDETIPEYVVCDPNRLRQILLNLLSNAVKFSSNSEGTIEVGIQQRQVVDAAIDVNKRQKRKTDRSMLFFTVKDPGLGLTKQQQSIIFDAYKQAEPSIARNYGGTGLGLSICRKLVTLMGGDIGVESEFGHGSTFWFQIPVSQCIAGNAKQDEMGSGSTHNLKEDDGHDEEVVHSSYHILVVEDNKVNIKIISKMLQSLGHSITVAENGRLALDAIMEQHRSTNGGCRDGHGSSNRLMRGFDVVLMDWQMPVMDGIEATKEIRRLGHSKLDLPVIGLTASIQDRDWLDSGMNECLKKPLRLHELKSALSRNLARNLAGKAVQGKSDQ